MAGLVPLAPMPADPSTTCRWCGGPCKAGVCEINCLPADAPRHRLTRARCPECLNQHDTGRVSSVEPCWRCERSEANLVASQAAVSGKPLTRYTRDMVQRSMLSRRSA